MKVSAKSDLRDLKTASPVHESSDKSSIIRSSKRYAYKNVYGMGTALMLVTSTTIGLYALQSTINSQLGLASLITLFASSVLVASASFGLISVLGTKNNHIISCLLTLIYCLCNYYPSWYTLIPSAVLAGAGMSMRWAALPAHIKGVSGKVAPIIGKEQSYLVGRYTGICFSFYYLAFIPGNLASSLIFFPYNSSTVSVADTEVPFSGSANLTMNEHQGCKGFDPESVGKPYFYSLLTVYAVFVIVGILVFIFCVDRLETENSFLSSDRKLQLYLKKPFNELLITLKKKETIFSIPVFFVTGIIASFAYGTITKHFISDCFGVYLVGFVVMVLGVSGAITGLVYGKVTKVVPRFVLVLLATSLCIGVVIFLLIWERVPSYPFIFCFAVLWGISESIFNTYAASLPGILFPGLDGAAGVYSMISLCGWAVGFLIAAVLSVRGQLWFVLSAVALAALSHLFVELILHRRAFSAKNRDEIPKSGTPSNNGATGINTLYFIDRNRKPSLQSNCDKSSSPTSVVDVATTGQVTVSCSAEENK